MTIVERDTSKYAVFSEGSILTALQKIEDSEGIVFSVTDVGVLEGLLTSGDILRWLIKQQKVDLRQPVSSITNKDFLFASPSDKPDRISSLLEKVLYIPIIDSHGHLLSVVRKRKPYESTKIGDFPVDEETPAVIIAEIGINHNGSLDLARQMIEEAARAGANCAKFQMRNMETLYHNAGDANDPKQNLGAQYTMDLLSRFQLSNEEMFSAFDYCQKQGVQPLCTPWDIESLEALEAYGMPAYKVASADLTNHDFLCALAKTGKPLICSTGMSTESEIVETVNLLKGMGGQYVLLHCNSTYPAPFKNINLNYLQRLKEIGGCPAGYSGHERGIHVVLAAVAKGAKVIEKHFTLDRSMEGNDHKVSLLPDEFAGMVEGIRQVEEALGSSAERELDQGEMMNRVTLAKSLVINCGLEPGDVIQEEMIGVTSPGRGVQPNRKTELIGKIANRHFVAGDFFYPSDLAEEQVQGRNYTFKRPWGVPVRYYDYKALLAQSNPDFLEFHMTYKDMDQDIHQFFDQTYDMGLVVHSPDFFTGDHLLNLCDEDKDYRQRSIRELQKVVELTRELQSYFTRASNPLIVASVGGATRDRHLEPSERVALYELLAESLDQLDTEGVEIIPQTLPPFPWYFGGQLYLSLFMDATDTAEFCDRYGYRICYDTCHSKLACNHFKWSFKKFTEQVGPYVAHLHISDAQGVDSEGLQIGEGDIDIPAMAEDLNRMVPQVSFIPEIWQGHENSGEGFWTALERMEGLF